MTLRHHFAIGFGAAALFLASSSPARAQQCGVASTTPLLAGQTIDAGEVNVYNDASSIYVRYATKAPWVLSDIHVAAADSVAGIPQTKRGNPIPGRFSYSASFNPEVTSYILAIPRAGTLAAGQQIVIAAHAIVQARNAQRGTETGWGFGSGFSGANWATYIAYDVKACEAYPE